MESKRLKVDENLWNETLKESYQQERRKGNYHVSDLTMCLRQTALSRKHDPVWNETTLYRFSMGRAMEKFFFSMIMPKSIQEYEVEKDGIVGHIDFGTCAVDYECKLTWGKEPKSPEELFKSKFWWVEQAGAYTYMRGRTHMNFVVCFLNPVPVIRCYQLKWEPEELEELWSKFLENKDYLEFKDVLGELPIKTPLTWLCKGCAYKEVCDASE